MRPNASFSLLLVLWFASCRCLGDDGSARRYGLPKGEEPLLTLCVLGRPDVQAELKLTAKQIATIKRVCSAKAEDIPGAKELLTNARKLQSDPALSASAKEKLGKALHDAMSGLCEAHQRRELSAVLSANQRQRLDEILIQMVGPIAILESPTISSKLQLSEKQTAEMADTAKHYESGFGWIRARYGRQQIAGLSKNESLQEREREVEALFVVIRAIEKERDADLLLGLTPAQLASWHTVEGKPFPIAWPVTSGCDCD